MTDTQSTTDTTIDEEAEDRTPEPLLLDLAQNQLRAIAPPTPRHPGAMGWQMMAASTMALASRLLHTVQRVAPAEAADIADWYHGPFGDGPDLMEFTEWLDVNVAQPAGADIEAWIADGRQRAQEAKQATERWENDHRDASDEPKRDIHTHFGLSYANYLVLPRTLLQSMPDAWQTKFVSLLGEFRDAFDHVPQPDAYIVQAAEEKEAYDLDVYERQVARVAADSDDDATTYTHTSLIGEQTQLDPDDHVLVPVVDPVPHYNRGRTRVEPRLDGGQ